ncbi:hypothetical protein HMPREF9440_02547 [Sutterella parvirubra YIT 11816]|uniref:Uncharacterized protein n=1 Tax=Sutterella parvirubra YIT 11816 TaxID=762967 RepID=H3KID5_9BURK|nr:hypothetical protein HMPREF9440_02547 [Sutterella parvirubra YIT 11816]
MHLRTAESFGSIPKTHALTRARNTPHSPVKTTTNPKDAKEAPVFADILKNA